VAILANRVRTKNSLLELSKFIIYSMKRFLALVLILISCYLLYFLPPKLFVNNLLEVVGRVSSVVSLIYKESIQNINFIYNRFSYFKDLETENLKLKLDVASLKNTNRLFSKIEWENRSLKKILHVTKEVNNNSVTAKIIGISATPFASYATIQGGTEDNINVNDIVRGAQGLIGRVSEVSNNYSTIIEIPHYRNVGLKASPPLNFVGRFLIEIGLLGLISYFYLLLHKKINFSRLKIIFFNPEFLTVIISLFFLSYGSNPIPFLCLSLMYYSKFSKPVINNNQK